MNCKETAEEKHSSISFYLHILLTWNEYTLQTESS